MSAGWQALGVRARALGTRLISERRFADLERSSAPLQLAEALAASGRQLRPVATVVELDQAIARTAAHDIEVLWRWAERTGTPTLLLDDEDHRSLRALMRGAAAAVSPEVRLAGLIPTPTLPRRALEALASSATARDVADQAATSHHPVAPFLTAALRDAGSELLDLDVALTRSFAARASRLARRGPRPLRRWVASAIDLQNAWSVLLVDAATAERAETRLFVSGGSLSARQFGALTRVPDEPARRASLAAAFAGTVLGAALADRRVPLMCLEERVLEGRLAEQRRAARLEPAGAAAVFVYLLSLRTEAIRLRRLAWRRSFEASPGAPATATGAAP